MRLPSSIKGVRPWAFQRGNSVQRCQERRTTRFGIQRRDLLEAESQNPLVEERDNNTRFFHNLANARKARIRYPLYPSTVLSQMTPVSSNRHWSISTNLYIQKIPKEKLGSKVGTENPYPLSNLPYQKTLEEIKKASFDLPKEKASSLDGFPLLFFQECWDTIKEDLTLFILPNSIIVEKFLES